MENKDKPAYPVGIKNTNDYTIVEGMTKREVMAMAAMQGILSNPGRSNVGGNAAKDALLMADELLKALDK